MLRRTRGFGFGELALAGGFLYQSFLGGEEAGEAVNLVLRTEEGRGGG